MTSVNLEVCVLTIPISGARKWTEPCFRVHKVMIITKITKDNQQDFYEKLFFAFQNHRDISDHNKK